MLYEGLSKRFSSKLIDVHNIRAPTGIDEEGLKAFYQRDPNILNHTLFKDSFYLYRFVDVLVDNVRHVHKTLPYILRTQYRNADKLFIACRDRQDYLEAMIEQGDDVWMPFFADVVVYMIVPMLRKYGFYSPIIVCALFNDLYRVMLIDYNNCNTTQLYYKKYTWMDLSEVVVNAFASSVYHILLQSEVVVWKSLQEGHRRNK
jgi:hypothetical protein